MLGINHVLGRLAALALCSSLSVATAGAWAAGPDRAHGGAANTAVSPTLQPRADADSAMRPAQQPSEDRRQLREVRATDLIGADVRNSQDMSLGEIENLIVDMKTGEVRYAILAFDPGILSDEKLWGVPTSELRMSESGNAVIYDLDRERLERATLDRSSFDDELVFDGKRVMNNLDEAYGLSQPSSEEQAHRASDLIGEDIVSRTGDGIGELEDLVIDMNHQRVHYAVLELDQGIASPERHVVVPLQALHQNLNGSALVLKVDDSDPRAMKSISDERWAHLDDRAWVADIDRYLVATFPTATSAGAGESKN
ncbi:MAG: PRC-barrel domain-containing protein [Burkholderiaceae bacterium]|nr:PRC-barrel domain-containing protein [Burkholderiaceae bacterium]